jgi:hypothetical protein
MYNSPKVLSDDPKYDPYKNDVWAAGILMF